jgi:hypothetical protein
MNRREVRVCMRQMMLCVKTMGVGVYNICAYHLPCLTLIRGVSLSNIYCNILQHLSIFIHLYIQYHL